MNGRGYFYSRCKEHSSYYVSTQLEVDCPYCEIDRLRGMMEASTDNYSSLYKEWADSQKQLAEARAENERLALENRQMLQGMKWDNQLRVEAHQEAARGIILMMSGATFEGPNKAKFEKVTEAFIGQILKTFKLEG